MRDMAEVGTHRLKHHDERFQDLPCLGADVRSRQLSRRRIDAGSTPDPYVLADLGDVTIRADRVRRVRWRERLDARFHLLAPLHGFGVHALDRQCRATQVASTQAGYVLICFQRKRNLVQQPAARWPDRQITSDFPKSCQARESKIFRFRSQPNQSHNSARLTADEGRSRSSRTRGEMRWTQELRLTCAACAYGEVVWFGRRGAGVKRAIRSAGDGGKRAVLREEHEVSRKAIAQGRPECSSCPVCSCATCYAQIARETAGAASTRSSLRPRFGARQVDSKARAQCAARSSSHIQLSSPAQAGDPVFQRQQ